MNYKKLLDHCEKWDSDPDSFSTLQTELVLMRMEIRCVMHQYLSIRDEIRDLERRQRKLKESGVAVAFLGPWITKRKDDLKKVHSCLAVCGSFVMDSLDRWQACGATLKDLCNLCNYPDYGFVKDEVKKNSDIAEASKFSSIMFIFNLDYPFSDGCEWIDDKVDAPFTHAVKAYVLDRMINTPEGRKASDVAFKETFPELWDKAMIRRVDDDGTEYFTDREGNRIDFESSR